MGVAMFGQDNNQDQNQWQPQGSPFVPPAGAPDPGADTSAPVAPGIVSPSTPDATTQGAPEPTASPDPQTETTPALPATGTVSNDDLLQIKQDALQQLSPLVGHLDQSPEEKFRTTMMMIQASDDHTLLQSAYDTAKQITDEKVRAQALLDVINEINYFTQQHHQA
jgi:hypothetical protein